MIPTDNDQLEQYLSLSHLKDFSFFLFKTTQRQFGMFKISEWLLPRHTDKGSWNRTQKVRKLEEAEHQYSCFKLGTLFNVITSHHILCWTLQGFAANISASETLSEYNHIFSSHKLNNLSLKQTSATLGSNT